MFLSCCAVQCVGSDDISPHVARFGPVHLRIQTYISALRPRMFLGYAVALLRRTVVQRCRTYGTRVRWGTRDEAFFSFDMEVPPYFHMKTKIMSGDEQNRHLSSPMRCRRNLYMCICNKNCTFVVCCNLCCCL
jgi:hypothetical protein